MNLLESPKSFSFSFVVLCVLLGILVLGGCERPEDTAENQETPKNVRVLKLAPDTLAEYFEITGPVAPVRGADISSQESGPVVKIQAAKGDPVAKNGPLLELERNILESEMESSRVALESQAYNLDKVQKLFDAGKVSQIELLNTRSQHQNAKALADISAERYHRALISAPFAGVVADRYVELGQMVLPGQPVLRVIDPYTLKLEGYLTGNQIAWAEVGTEAQVALGTQMGTTPGTITWVGLEADVQTGKFKVEIEIPNPDLKFRSGVIGRAQIPKNLYHDVVTIPRDAVMEGRHGPEVFTVRENHAYRQSIVLGPDQGWMVVVRDGLAAGDLLVVRGHRDLVEGSLVHIAETATSANGSLESDPSEVREDGTGATP